MNLRRLTEAEAKYSEMPKWMRAMMPEPDYGIFVFEEDQEEKSCLDRLEKGAF